MKRRAAADAGGGGGEEAEDEEALRAGARAAAAALAQAVAAVRGAEALGSLASEMVARAGAGVFYMPLDGGAAAARDMVEAPCIDPAQLRYEPLAGARTLHLAADELLDALERAVPPTYAVTLDLGAEEGRGGVRASFLPCAGAWHLVTVPRYESVEVGGAR